MNIFQVWLVLLEPIVCKAIAIIPHLKEIINIAFKPHNGRDLLCESDHNNLSNRINFIDDKMKYISKDERKSMILDKKQRGIIIDEYKENLNRIENSLIEDFIRPTIEELMEEEPNFVNITVTKYTIFFQEEMEHSLNLFEQVFFDNPIKASLIRDLEMGLDHLIHLNPKRLDNILNLPVHPGNDLYGRIRTTRTLGERNCIVLLSFMNYFLNEIGVRRDGFLFQFHYFGIRDIYSILIELYHKRNTQSTLERLTTMFDKTTIQCTIIIRLLKNTSVKDKELVEYFFPRLPLSDERKRLYHFQKRFTDGFSYSLPEY